jgi:hypothetical protein
VRESLTGFGYMINNWLINVSFPNIELFTHLTEIPVLVSKVELTTVPLYQDSWKKLAANGAK